ncbi:hypothetical protein BDF20DRAFT_900833 [Mycotypha africana]|uniref:uncharacterized protein n=1 Tax=Mycotypha africana TaxID=64632 RepID=UPI0023012914|nr:uncharacterized protein BDF20DRAFT_900833 [Mycotypha africana]KAI8967393.1 hypothetical protein BDF20DRAFT_900833 [Mycotypha africana]
MNASLSDFWCIIKGKKTYFNLQFISNYKSRSLSIKQPQISHYTKAKELAAQHDPELNVDEAEVSFCNNFILQILKVIKHQPSLFNDTINNSEWDYIVKFWGVVIERLFHFTDLRLKWGDTYLTLADTIKNMPLKVDLRILHDGIRQRYNVKNEVGVAEVSDEDPGDAKFTSDRCKLLIESKSINQRKLMTCAY